MAKYYGIRIVSADRMLDGCMRDYAQSGNDIIWFTSEQAAINFCDEHFKQKEEQRKVLPELYEHERCSLSGAAYIWYEDKLPTLVPGANKHAGYIGTGAPMQQKEAEFVYLPPKGFESAHSPYGSRPYTYSVIGHEEIIPEIAKAYTEEGRIKLPDTYQPKLVSPDRVFVHYGTTHFDTSLFEDAYTRSFDVKPESGFWASPIDSSNNWDNWCKAENFTRNHPNVRCEFTFEPGSKVIQVSTLDDIAFLLKNYPLHVESGMLPFGTYMEQGLPYLMIDYEAMAEDFDGLSYDHSALGNILGPWDCDSVCVMNPHCMLFREIELVPVDPSINYDEFSDICPDEDWLDEEEW